MAHCHHFSNAALLLRWAGGIALRKPSHADPHSDPAANHYRDPGTLRSFPISNADALSDSDAAAAYRYPNRLVHPHDHQNAKPYSDRFADQYSHGYTDLDADSHSLANGYTHPNPDFHARPLGNNCSIADADCRGDSVDVEYTNHVCKTPHRN